VGIDTLSSSRGYRHGRSARYHIAKDKPSQPGRKNDMALQDINPTTKTALGDMDEAAQFEVGLRQHMSFLRSFARALSGNRELAEDLAQGALTKAWQCRDSFTVGTNLKAWLCTILRNEFYSHRRRAWRQVPWDTELVAGIAAPPGEHQWATELSDAVRAMHELPDTQREALILVGVGGFSYGDAAVLSKSAVGTIKSRVARARRALKESLDSGCRPLPIRPRPESGNAMSALLAQVSHLRGFDATHAVA
jgi:RNA polymerase sigma-70 factor (ECF subfamily)